MAQHTFRTIVRQAFPILLLFSFALSQSKTPSRVAPLKTIADVPLPGPAVRFDYQSRDPTTGRLYIAHMNADHLIS